MTSFNSRRLAIFSPLHLLGFSILVLMLIQMYRREPTSSKILPLPTTLVGVYEPGNTVRPLPGVNTSHGFFDLSDLRVSSQISQFLDRCSEARTLPIVTLEPFSLVGDDLPARTRLQGLLAGRQDHLLQRIRYVLQQRTSPVLIRVAHEMDVPSQYPWWFSNPSDYKALYRLIYHKLHTQAAHPLLWVWSPQGRPQSAGYWPGAAYVDLIGISVFSSRRWSLDGQLPSFADIVESRLWLSQRFKRPLLAVEVGVSASPNEQVRWIKAAGQWMQSRPSILLGLVYFQSRQPEFIAAQTGEIDWRLPAQALQQLVSSLSIVEAGSTGGDR